MRQSTRFTIISLLLCGFVFVSQQAGASSQTSMDNDSLKIIMDQAQERILEHRQGKIKFVLMENGKAISGAKIELWLLRHNFLFGCNAYGLNPNDTSKAQKMYQDKFKKVFNYATLPFYWGSYEKEEGNTNEEKLKAMANWCLENDIIPKGHPLIWHEVFPEWANDLGDEFEQRLKERVSEIVSDFAGLIDYWDVINESSIKEFPKENLYVDWLESEGCATIAAKGFAWTQEANPDAFLLINDYNVRGNEYPIQIDSLIEMGVFINAIGLQSHMHKGETPIEEIIYESRRYGERGIPVHFTEATMISGDHKVDDDWHSHRDDWISTTEGEERQAEYVELFYTVLFSLPEVEAITWWDFSDAHAWMGAPAGFLRKDMTEKPAYYALDRLINNAWHTAAQGITDEEGKMEFRGFYGTYELKIVLPDGSTITREELLDTDEMEILIDIAR